MHGGTLEAAERRRGTRIGVHHLAARAATAALAAARQRTTHATSTDSTARRILVVDDNDDAAEMLAVMLHGWGHDTRVAYDGLDRARPSADEFQPEIVLLDLGLPDSTATRRDAGCARPRAAAPRWSWP